MQNIGKVPVLVGITVKGSDTIAGACLERGCSKCARRLHQKAQDEQKQAQCCDDTIRCYSPPSVDEIRRMIHMIAAM